MRVRELNEILGLKDEEESTSSDFPIRYRIPEEAQTWVHAQLYLQQQTNLPNKPALQPLAFSATGFPIYYTIPHEGTNFDGYSSLEMNFIYNQQTEIENSNEEKVPTGFAAKINVGTGILEREFKWASEKEGLKNIYYYDLKSDAERRQLYPYTSSADFYNIIQRFKTESGEILYFTINNHIKLKNSGEYEYLRQFRESDISTAKGAPLPNVILVSRVRKAFTLNGSNYVYKCSPFESRYSVLSTLNEHFSPATPFKANGKNKILLSVKDYDKYKTDPYLIASTPPSDDVQEYNSEISNLVNQSHYSESLQQTNQNKPVSRSIIGTIQVPSDLFFAFKNTKKRALPVTQEEPLPEITPSHRLG